MKYLVITAVAAAALGASSASAQFSVFSQSQSGTESPSPSVNQQTIVNASEMAKINRIRSMAGPSQYRPIKTCDTDIAYGTNDNNGPELTSRRRETYIGNIEVYAGGFCPSGSRGRR